MCNMEQGTKTIPAVETWRPVKGFEGLYEVSSLARVRSLDRQITKQHNTGTYYLYNVRGKMMNPEKAANGYLVVKIYKEGKTYHKLVHRLVAEAFVPNPDNLPEVNHKDEDKTNNLPSNLEWCDHKYNLNYGTVKQKISSKNGKPIEQLTMAGQHVAFFDNPFAAQRVTNGRFKAVAIQYALDDKNKTAYGYQWRRI